MGAIDFPYLSMIFERALRVSRGLNFENPFGIGPDGNIVYSTNQVLTAPFLRYSNLTVNAGVTVTASTGNPLIIIVQNTLTVAGTLCADGLGAAGGTSGNNAAGNPGTAGTFWNWNGAIPNASTSAGSGAGGGVSSYGDLLSTMPLTDALQFFLFGSGGGGGTGSNSSAWAGGTSPGGLTAGGGGGGISGAGSGGGSNGGAGGGQLTIIAKNIVVASGGQISANGLQGTAGTGTSHGGAGGGAGGGLLLAYRTLGNSGTIQANGGNGADTTNDGLAGGQGGSANIALPFRFASGTQGPGSSTVSGGGGASGIVMPFQI